MEDNQIVKMIWNRDETALSALSSKYSSYCYSIAYNILNDSEDSEECVNDTWLGVWNSIPPHHPEVLKTYAGKITRNISLKRWDEKHSKKRCGGQVTLALDELAECIPSKQCLEEEIQMAELVHAINAFLKSLPAEEVQVFVCRYWFFDSIASISEQFGFSQSKIKSKLHRTRKKLLRFLKTRGVSYEG